MALQNRVRPDGAIVASPHRGTLMGNRGGPFHTAEQTLRPRHWHSRQWICCLLEFNQRQRKIMQPRRYTELFFLDEATALAAGHRPCFECRRAAAEDFARRWNSSRGRPGRARAGDMDRELHDQRLDGSGRKRAALVPIDFLPDHAFIEYEGNSARIAGRHIQVWSLAGYGARLPRPRGETVVCLTPPAIMAVLGAGYVPMLHKSAAS